MTPTLISGPQTRNWNDRSREIDIGMIVVHGISEFILWAGSPIHAITWLTFPSNSRPRVSAHAVIEPDGKIIQICDPGLRAWHAGHSHWKGRDDVNDFSLGVELLVHGTHDYGSFKAAIEREHAYKPMQYESLGWLCAKWAREFEIDLDDIRGHSEVSGDDVRGEGKGKIDPGGGFQWRRFYGWLGHYLYRDEPNG